MRKLSRRAWLSTTGAGSYLAAAAQTTADTSQAGSGLHRTQFDNSLLTESAAPPVAGNHDRQMFASQDGSVITALAWGGASPVLRIWRDRALLAEHKLPAGVAGPVLSGVQQGQPVLWFSAGGRVASLRDWRSQPADVPGVS